jgi:diaminopimelate epimerase
VARLPVIKCQGTGNDFVLLDNGEDAYFRYPDLAKTLCNRRYGVGGDGLLVLLPSTRSGVDVVMRIFNADGSEAEMCGNGVRCVARYWFESRRDAPRSLAIQTAGAVVRTEIVELGPRFAVRVAMGAPREISSYEKPVKIGDVLARFANVSMGNPHRVALIDESLDDIDLDAFANEVESLGSFPDGVNVEIARADSDLISMRVRERGVGETLACGSGACAVAVAAILAGRAASPVTVTMPGGEVVVDWAGPGEIAYLTGGAEIVFRADVEIGDSLTAPAGVFSR